MDAAVMCHIFNGELLCVSVQIFKKVSLAKVTGKVTYIYTTQQKVRWGFKGSNRRQGKGLRTHKGRYNAGS
jgi:hypothetical protein